jgi:hypothetical protein
VVHWEEFSALIFEPVPWLLRSFVASNARSNVDQTLHRHGIGRHDTADIVRFGIDGNVYAMKDGHCLLASLQVAPNSICGDLRSLFDLSGGTDLEALSALLGDKPFFLGDQFTSVDCTAFAHLVLITDGEYALPFKQAIESNPAMHNLKAYVARVKEQYWPDWEDRVAGKN